MMFTRDKRNNFENAPSDDCDAGTCSVITHETRAPPCPHFLRDNTWQYVTIPRVCGDHCSCNVTRSINMFYPVLINTHTRWHRTRVTRIWGMSHTAHILSTTFFGIRAIDNYDQFIRHASDHNDDNIFSASGDGAQVWSERAELKTSCGVTIQGDKPALVIVFLHSWQPRPFLPSSGMETRL